MPKLEAENSSEKLLPNYCNIWCDTSEDNNLDLFGFLVSVFVNSKMGHNCFLPKPFGHLAIPFNTKEICS
jgi:hypothetical protein